MIYPGEFPYRYRPDLKVYLFLWTLSGLLVGVPVMGLFLLYGG